MELEERYATSREMKRHIRLIRDIPTYFDKNMDKVNWKVIRKIIDVGHDIKLEKKECKMRKHTLNGVKTYVFTPPVLLSDDLIIYMHGGGFVTGGASWPRGYLSSLANLTNMRVVSIEYRLAPENKYPKAILDCLAVYKYIIRKYPDSNICFIGESAGANLVLSLYFRAKYSNLKLPDALICNSGIYDMSDNIKRKKTTDYKVHEDCIPVMREMYAEGEDYKNSLISPLYGEFDNFPDTLIICDKNETLYQDSYELYKKLKENDVNGKMIVYHDTYHAFVTMGKILKESNDVLQDTSEFITKTLRRTP